jgi:hypothetical protein
MGAQWALRMSPATYILLVLNSSSWATDRRFWITSSVVALPGYVGEIVHGGDGSARGNVLLDMGQCGALRI